MLAAVGILGSYAGACYATATSFRDAHRFVGWPVFAFFCFNVFMVGFAIWVGGCAARLADRKLESGGPASVAGEIVGVSAMVALALAFAVVGLLYAVAAAVVYALVTGLGGILLISAVKK